MDVQDLLHHLAGASWPGLGTLFAVWLVWQLWRRLFRAALVCAVIGLVLYVAFPGAAHQLIHGAMTTRAGLSALGGVDIPDPQ